MADLTDQQRLGTAIAAGHVATAQTCLGRVARVHDLDVLPGGGCLVAQEPLQLGKAPAVEQAALLTLAVFATVTDALQIFNAEHGAWGCSVHDAPRDHVVGRSRKPLPVVPKPPQMALGAPEIGRASC